jgi:hypothetical protein
MIRIEKNENFFHQHDQVVDVSGGAGFIFDMRAEQEWKENEMKTL